MTQNQALAELAEILGGTQNGILYPTPEGWLDSHESRLLDEIAYAQAEHLDYVCVKTYSGSEVDLTLEQALGLVGR